MQTLLLRTAVDSNANSVAGPAWKTGLCAALGWGVPSLSGAAPAEMCSVVPPQEKKRRQQRVRLDKVTNTHMPELFLGSAPQNIDER
jgi:hypothetical protein